MCARGLRVVDGIAVVQGWCDELARFAPALTVAKYGGDPAERAVLQERLTRSGHLACDVLVTSYDYCLRDEAFFGRIK